MAKRLETSAETIARPDSSLLSRVLIAVAVLLLAAGIVIAFTAGSWAIVAVLIAALGVVIVFAANSFMQARRLLALTEQKRIEWETALPEIQRQNLNLEVFELSKLLEVESGQIGDLQSAYIVAEDLALRQIQQEENVPLMRHVTLGKAPFDAVLVKNDVVSCIEVAFLVAPDLRQERIDAIMRKIALVKETFAETQVKMKLRLMMVLVTQLTPEDEEHLRSVLTPKRFTAMPVDDFVICFLDFESLQRIYVTD